MIAEIAKIKRIRLDRQTREVRSLESELTDIRSRKEQLIQSIEKFAQWMSDEKVRIFKELMQEPASLDEIDNYNGKLSQLKVQKNDMLFNLKQVEEEELAAQKSLAKAVEKMRAAEQAEEKFQSLAADITSEQIRKRNLEEEKTNEEMAADSSQSNRLSEPAFTVLTGA